MAELEKIHRHLDTNDKRRGSNDRELLQQLSTLDFTAVQKDIYAKRYANTGQWLLESAEFQTWLKSRNGDRSVLWYQGNPGVGKTVITSIAVNYLTENFGGSTNAIIYMFCDYANSMTFSVENLLGSMVRQLVAQTVNVEKIAELKAFLRGPAKNRNMGKEEASSWIRTFSREFDVVYTFVDALDESPEICRNTLLARFQQYSLGNMRIFLTSRANVDVTLKLPNAVRAKIAATTEDITTIVESRILESARLVSFTDRDPDLKQHIVDTINTQANGMIFLARLQVESLDCQISVKRVRSALEKLPTDFFVMYDGSIDRIRCQAQPNAELGLRTLSFIFAAARPLIVDELRHALAVTPSDTTLDPEALVDLDILLSVTAGLVITSLYQPSKQKVFRLVHYTLQEYLEINQEQLFPDLHVDIATACLAYLSLDDFGGGHCATCHPLAGSGKDWLLRSNSLILDPTCKRMRYEQRRHRFVFLDYASYYWAYHLRGVQMELMDESLAFVQDGLKTASWLQNIEKDEKYDVGLSTDEDLPLDPVFLAAHFHLPELFKRLISNRDINCRNHRRETPLHRAVDFKPWKKGGPRYPAFEVVGTKKTGLDWFDDENERPSQEGIPLAGFEDDETWRKGPKLYSVRSFDLDQRAMVQIILERNADLEAKSRKGTAAYYALEKGDCAILALLADHGAIIDPLLHIAVEDEERIDIMQTLLDRGADVNVLNESGASLAHIAATHRSSAMLDCLIDRGAPFDIADEHGMTPLLLAAERGKLEMVETLIKRGARVDVTDSMGVTFLHYAVSQATPEIVAIAMQTQEIDKPDMYGRTPLHHAYYICGAREIRGEIFGNWKYDIKIVIQQLLQGGASETIADAYGEVPKHYLDWPAPGYDPNYPALENGIYWHGSYIMAPIKKQEKALSNVSRLKVIRRYRNIVTSEYCDIGISCRGWGRAARWRQDGDKIGNSSD